MLPEHLELIQRAAEKEGFKNWAIEYDAESGNGGHYLGVINAITVKDKGTNRKISFILKTAQTSEEARTSRAIIPAFETELEFYSVVLPGLLKFQRTYRLTAPFSGVPNYYGGIFENKKEAIVMENLKFNGYKLWNGLEPMDFDHMALVIKEYAKLHVISLALRHTYPEHFEDLTKNIKRNFLEQREDQNPEHYRHLVKAILGMGRKAVQGHQRAEKGYRAFETGYPNMRKRDKECPEKDVLVVSHGDCHANNILFKYEDTNCASKPTKVSFIDWQLSSTESPMHDLTFALGSCASKEVLKRSEELLQMYHNLIAQSLREYGCDPDKVFSPKAFKEHWKKHLFHGLYRAQTNLKLTLMTEEEFAAIGESTISILDALRIDFSLDSKFAHRIRDLYEIVGDKWL